LLHAGAVEVNVLAHEALGQGLPSLSGRGPNTHSLPVKRQTLHYWVIAVPKNLWARGTTCVESYEKNDFTWWRERLYQM